MSQNKVNYTGADDGNNQVRGGLEAMLGHRDEYKAAAADMRSVLEGKDGQSLDEFNVAFLNGANEFFDAVENLKGVLGTTVGSSGVFQTADNSIAGNFASLPTTT